MNGRTRWFWAIIGISVLLFSHIVAYYLGYRTACREFVDQCVTEALSDQVAASVYTYYPQEQEDVDSAAEEESEASVFASEASELSSEESEESDFSEAANKNQVFEERERMPKQIVYEARLAGFATRVAAERYAHQLRQEDIEVKVVSWDTRSSRGKHITWYQVVTAPQQYDALTKLVNHLKKRDKLEGVVFVEASSTSQGPSIEIHTSEESEKGTL